MINTKLDIKEECVLCGSAGEARDVIRKLADLKIKIAEVPSKEKDKEKMGYGVVRLDISRVPRGVWSSIIKMAY